MLVHPISDAPFNILSDQLSIVSLVSHTEASNPLVGQIDFLVTSIHIAAARGGVGLSKHTHHPLYHHHSHLQITDSVNRQRPRDLPHWGLFRVVPSGCRVSLGVFNHEKD